MNSYAANLTQGLLSLYVLSVINSKDGKIGNKDQKIYLKKEVEKQKIRIK